MDEYTNNKTINKMSINDQLIHSIRTENICNSIRVANKISSVYGLGVGSSEEEDLAEHWSFDTIGESIQLQAVTCMGCGDYIFWASSNRGIHKNINCKCPNQFDSVEEINDRKNKQKKEYELMNEYAAFDALIGEVLSEGACDLCEHVIGEIMRFWIV